MSDLELVRSFMISNESYRAESGKVFHPFGYWISRFLNPPPMKIFKRLTERPYLLPPRQTLQEESRWSLENNISLESGHSLELGGEEHVAISCIERRALRWRGGVKCPKFFKLFNRGFREEDLVDIFSEVLFSPIVVWVKGNELFVESISRYVFSGRESKNSAIIIRTT